MTQKFLWALQALVLGMGASRARAADANPYAEAEKKCGDAGSYSCCTSSLNIMKKGKFLPEPEGGCPAGTRREMLRCIDTIVWCEPVAADLKPAPPIAPPLKHRPSKYDAPGCLKFGMKSTMSGVGFSKVDPPCCKGLVDREQTQVCGKAYGGGYPYVCLACGDGKCDAGSENACNCPEDCKKN